MLFLFLLPGGAGISEILISGSHNHSWHCKVRQFSKPLSAEQHSCIYKLYGSAGDATSLVEASSIA
jgi:hypothetical protein